MRIFKKITASFLSLVIISAAVPVGSFAATDDDEPVEALSAVCQNAEDAEKEALENREELENNNTVEINRNLYTGLVLEDGKTYVFRENISIFSENPTESAITVPENSTAVIQIDKGVTVNATGSDAYQSVGAGAGIHLPLSATLIVRGEGTLKAVGGNAAKGEAGANGENALFNLAARNGRGIIYGGNGGNGGSGGGGAGAGIGGCGGSGGTGGTGGTYPGAGGGKYTFPRDAVTGLKLLSENNGMTQEQSEVASNLFDGSVETKYCIYSDKTVSVVFRSNQTEKVTSYELFTANDTAKYGRLPLSWVLYGSVNSRDWKVIDTVKTPGMTKDNLKGFKYSVDSAGSYCYYRIDFEPDKCLQLSELKLYPEAAHFASPCEADGVTADCNGGSGGAGETGSAGEKCGTLYVLDKAVVIGIPGKDALSQNGAKGKPGAGANDAGSGYKNFYTAGGGGAGGGGTGGLAPEYGIGCGGAGGSGGGGGGAGSSRYADHNVYKEDYAAGGSGGSGFGSGGTGVKFGTQKGGDGGRCGARYENKDGASGNICVDTAAKVEGRLDGDIQKGSFIFGDDGSVVNLSCISVKTLDDLTLENNRIYRFDKNVTFTAKPTQDAISLPEYSKIIFEIPSNTEINLTGGKASGSLGAGAAINVPPSTTLIIRGSGKLNARGGDAADAQSAGSPCAGGGAGAGIGGSGGDGISASSLPQRGTDCGTVYITGTLKLTAESGKAGAATADYSGGNAADYGIGGGGSGGNKAGGSIQISGNNGDVFIDYASTNVTGREAYYHRADLSVDVMGDVNVSGYSDLILGTAFSDGVSVEKLYLTLREAANHNALKKNSGWYTGKMPDENGNKTNDRCNGAYVNQYNEWNKSIIDVSGGYVYLFTTYFGRYVKSVIAKGDNPDSIAKRVWDSLRKYADGKKLYISNDMRDIIREILFFQHYCEPFATYRSDGYVIDHTTNNSYDDIDKALTQVNYTYTCVLDSKTARYATVSYDTFRTSKWKFPKSGYYYYNMSKNSFSCTDGYKGVTMQNWMKYIPENASVAQLNMPGTHDTGTFNVKINPEMISVLIKNTGNILEDFIGVWAKVLAAVSGLLIPAAMNYAFGLPVISQVLELALPVLLIKLPDIVQYFIEALSRCNNLTVEQQLNSGLRVFDLRMVYDTDRNIKDLTDASLKKNEKYYEAGFLKLVHGTLEEFDFEKYEPDHDVSIADGHNPDGSILTFKNVLNECLAFVSENKSESVYLSYKCEGSDNKNKRNNGAVSNYSQALGKVLEEMKNDPRIVILKDGDVLPTVKEAAGKVYLIERSQMTIYEDHYDLNSKDKINVLKTCFKESESNNLRQNYTDKYRLQSKNNPAAVDKRDYCPRMVYASTYNIVFHKNFFYEPWATPIITGSPKDIAIDEGKTSVNYFLETYVYQRGQYYGWIYMNFPTQMATSNIVFSNVFDLSKLVEGHTEGSIFTHFNAKILFGGIILALIPAVAVPVVKKRKEKKTAG